MNPVTVAPGNTVVANCGSSTTNNMIGGGLAVLGVILASNNSPVIGIALIAFGVGTMNIIDCSVVPPGNACAGQTTCQSILGKMIGPL